MEEKSNITDNHRDTICVCKVAGMKPTAIVARLREEYPDLNEFTDGKLKQIIAYTLNSNKWKNRMAEITKRSTASGKLWITDPKERLIIIQEMVESERGKEGSKKEGEFVDFKLVGDFLKLAKAEAAEMKKESEKKITWADFVDVVLNRKRNWPIFGTASKVQPFVD